MELIRLQPTTSKSGTVTLVLLRGPSTNVQPLYPIVENAPNTGSYIWTPSTDLEEDVTRYGLQLIVDATGQFQVRPSRSHSQEFIYMNLT